MVKNSISNSDTKIFTGQVKLKIDSLESEDYIELIIPASDVNTVRKIQKAINVSIEKGIKSHSKDLEFPEVKLPIKYAYLDNNHILQVKISRFSKFIYSDKSIIKNIKDLYSGCVVRALLNVYPVFNGDEKGIHAELSILEKIRDGDI